MDSRATYADSQCHATIRAVGTKRSRQVCELEKHTLWRIESEIPRTHNPTGRRCSHTLVRRSANYLIRQTARRPPFAGTSPSSAGCWPRTLYTQRVSAADHPINWDCGEHLTPLGLVSGFQKSVTCTKDVLKAGASSSLDSKNGAPVSCLQIKVVNAASMTFILSKRRW
jgi:hypothetical protein